MNASVHGHDVSLSWSSPVKFCPFHWCTRKYRFVICSNDQSVNVAFCQHMNVLIQQL